MLKERSNLPMKVWNDWPRRPGRAASSRSPSPRLDSAWRHGLWFGLVASAYIFVAVLLLDLTGAFFPSLLLESSLITNDALYSARNIGVCLSVFGGVALVIGGATAGLSGLIIGFLFPRDEDRIGAIVFRLVLPLFFAVCAFFWGAVLLLPIAFVFFVTTWILRFSWHELLLVGIALSLVIGVAMTIWARYKTRGEWFWC
jgi:hypothetical protein